METKRQVLKEWHSRNSITQIAHYLSADKFRNKKLLLGIPTVILTTIVGTSVFATLQNSSNDTEPIVKILLGLASVTAAILSSLQTFLGYSERAEKHRLAGAKYGALGRELETLLTFPEDTIPQETIDKIRIQLDGLAIESPNNSQKIYILSEKVFKKSENSNAIIKNENGKNSNLALT